MARILIVDDEPAYAAVLRGFLGDEHTVECVLDTDDALARLESASFDAVLTDLFLPPGPDGIELIRRARALDVDAPFIVLTGNATVETAVRAMREGAFHYLRKGASRDEIRAILGRALDGARAEREVRRLRGEADAQLGDRIIGDSAPVRELLNLAHKVALADASVLVLGESGTGKELLARCLHRWSPRAAGPFVAFDGSALSPALVESELFGHEKGAFTGASRARRGLFREAGGGTLFLDEIGDLPGELQNKLLRVLQEREVKPVGGDVPVKIDVRIVAATHRDLRVLVAEGRFREDLYYRLAVVPLTVPPLRSRRGDLAMLVEHLLTRRRTAGPRPLRADAEAIAGLAAYDWPGNVRELENVVERAAILSDGICLRAADLPPLGNRSRAREGEASTPARSDGAPVVPVAAPLLAPDAATQQAGAPATLKDRVAEATAHLERQAIRDALSAEGGSPTRAARRLGMSRASLYEKIRRLGIPL